MKITKYKNGEIVEQYNINNIDIVQDMALELHTRKISEVGNSLTCDVHWGSREVGGKGHTLALRYNDNTMYGIDK